MGCFSLLLMVAVVGWTVQGIAFVWVHYWPMIVGLSLSWISLRYINREKESEP